MLHYYGDGATPVLSPASCCKGIDQWAVQTDPDDLLDLQDVASAYYPPPTYHEEADDIVSHHLLSPWGTLKTPNKHQNLRTPYAWQSVSATKESNHTHSRTQ